MRTLLVSFWPLNVSALPARWIRVSHAQRKKERARQTKQAERTRVMNLVAMIEGMQTLADVVWQDGHRSQVWSNDLLPEVNSGAHDFLPGLPVS